MLSLSFNHLLSVDQLKQSDIERLVELADKLRHASSREAMKQAHCQYNILATLFFEPSTRTRFSFESAMLRLGGQIISLEQGISSSIKKGETMADMSRVISCYADIVVMRHPDNGSVAEFATQATIPIINAGDGSNQHPTQSLVDLYTILCEKKRLDRLNIAVMGDLKYGRAAHSFIELMSQYSDNDFLAVSDPGLKLPAQVKTKLQHLKLEETTSLRPHVKDIDVLYVTRMQKERFSDTDHYPMVQGMYPIDNQMLADSKKDLIIMHPLPRVNEIDPAIDRHPAAKYFDQVAYSVYIRMALLSLMQQSSV